MRWAITQLVRCDAIQLPPGWKESRGAMIEHQLAMNLRIRAFQVATHITEHHA